MTLWNKRSQNDDVMSGGMKTLLGDLDVPPATRPLLITFLLGNKILDLLFIYKYKPNGNPVVNDAREIDDNDGGVISSNASIIDMQSNLNIDINESGCTKKKNTQSLKYLTPCQMKM